MRILVTDGMEKAAVAQLQANGHEVVEQYFEPDALGAALQEFDCVVVRSKTKVRANHIDEAIKVAVDSKTQNLSVCNAAETLLVHRGVAAYILPRLKEKLEEVRENKSERNRWISHFTQFSSLETLDRKAVIHMIKSIHVLGKNELKITFAYEDEYAKALKLISLAEQKEIRKVG